MNQFISLDIEHLDLEKFMREALLEAEESVRIIGRYNPRILKYMQTGGF
jgi:hypothetical protein